MKLRSKFLLTLSLLVFFAGNSCRKDVLDHNKRAYSDPSEALDRDDNPGVGLTVLGAKLNNPYALNVVKQAYQNLYHTAISTLQPTHLYVRFLPVTPQQLGLLDINNGEYWDFPLDYKISHMGDYYHDPGVTDTTFTWLYTVVPYGYQFPAVPHEILEQLVYVPDETQLLKEAYRLTANTWDEPDAYLATPTFHDGVLEFATPNDGGGGNGGGDGGGGSNPPATECGCPLPDNVRKPSGCVTVFDTQFSAFEPVRHIEVITAKDDLGLFFENKTETSDKGCFSIDHKYHGRIHLWIKFKSDYCHIKTMKGWADIDGYSFARKGYKGTFGGPYFNDLAIRLSPNGDVKNADHLNWIAATANNALHEYRDWCTANGNITFPPYNMKILITPLANRTGATVMLDKMPLFTQVVAGLASVAVSALVGWWSPVGTTIAVLGDMLIGWLAICAPDVILNFSNGAEPSDRVKEVAYHEFSHTSHWVKSGDSYWQANILYVALIQVTQANNSPYGSGTINGYQRCAVIEGWGFHVGATLSDAHYGVHSSNYIFQDGTNAFAATTTLSSYIRAEEAFNPGLAADPYRWIPKGIFHDLIDNAVEIGSITDAVNGGFTEKQLFDCLDVTNVGDLKTNVQAVTGNTQQNQVNSLFSIYGY